MSSTAPLETPLATSKPKEMQQYDYDYAGHLEALSFRPRIASFTYIEVRNFEDGRDNVTEVGVLREDEVSKWLADDRCYEACSGGLRLLLHFGQQDLALGPSTIDFGKSVFTDIMDAFHLPKAYVKAIHDDTGIFGRFWEHKTNSTGYVLKPLSAVVMYLNGLYTHCHHTAITTGLIRFNFPNVSRDLIASVVASASLASHPMLVAIVYAEWQMKRLSTMSKTIGSELLAIERITGHTVIHGLKRKPQLTDHHSITSQLSKTSYVIASAELYAASLGEVCTFIRESLDRIMPEHKRRDSFSEDDQVIRDRLMCLTSSARQLLLKFVMYQKRAQFQLSTIYNLIAQQDSMANIEVAKDSKSIARASQRDSTSMKTIAVLTTSFLPATWVSSFFAMPLFNWNAAPGEAVLGERFWIYWALTLPLTLAVMASWWTWMSWRERQNANQDRLDRQSAAWNSSKFTESSPSSESGDKKERKTSSFEVKPWN